MPNVLILGMGNPVLTDDAIGLLAIDHLEETLAGNFSGVEFKKNYSGGIDLLYELVDFEKVVIIDSICTGQSVPGSVHEFSLEDLEAVTQPRLVDSHGLNLPTVIETGLKCGYQMPREIAIFGIESTNFLEFSETPTLEVLDSLEDISRMVKSKLSRWIGQVSSS